MSSSLPQTDMPHLSLGPDEFGDERVISRIVVPVLADSGHDRGIEVAQAWGTRWRLPVLLLTVDLSSPDTVDIAIGQHLARSRDRLAATGLDVSEEVLAADEVPHAVTDRLADGDLVIMSSAGAAGSPTASHGWQLAQARRGPVLLVGPAVVPGPPDGPVVATLDGSPLAEKALPTALALTASLGTRLWLIQAVGHQVVEQIDVLRRRGDDASASAYLRQTAKRLGAPGPASDTADNGLVGWEVIETDEPVDALTGFTRSRQAAAVVMTSHGRSGLRAEAFGSTALAVVATAPAPVLITVPAAGEQPSLTATI